LHFFIRTLLKFLGQTFVGSIRPNIFWE